MTSVRSSSSPSKRSLSFDSEISLPLLSQNEQRRIMGTSVLSWFIVNSTYTLMVPFYPLEALQRKIWLPWVGVVFGCFHLVGFMVMPLANYLSRRLGNKLIFMMGLFLEASATIGFGYVTIISATHTFLIVCITIRIIHAIGSGFTQKAAYAIVVGLVPPEQQNNIVGLLESAGGFGLFLGPIIGGVSYELSTFKIPFLTMGCLIAIFLLAVLIMIPQDNDVDSNQIQSSGHMTPTKTNIKYGAILLSISVIIIIMGSFGFMEPILATFLQGQDFNLTCSQIGLLFSMMYLVYAFSAPIGVYLTRKIGNLPAMWFGILILICSFLLLGPTKTPDAFFSEFTDLLTDQIWLQILALITIALGTAIGIPPALVFMNNAVVGSNKHDLLAKLSMFAFAFGSGGGALVSSILSSHFSNLRWATALYSGGLCIILLFITLFGCTSYFHADMRNSVWSLNTGTPSSRSPLFSSTSTNYSIPGQGMSASRTRSTQPSHTSRVDDSRQNSTARALPWVVGKPT